MIVQIFFVFRGFALADSLVLRQLLQHIQQFRNFFLIRSFMKMETNSHSILRMAGRMVNVVAVIGHIVIFILGIFYPPPLFAINLLMHLSWLYGHERKKMVFMAVPVYLWIFTACLSIFIMCFFGHESTTDDIIYAVVALIIFLIFYTITILATYATKKIIVSNQSSQA
ncbi:uncharacterized protein LOC116347239 [Contarinia nasturtii]|uniref:uncharacterized protein LOC116347239 n=1 Tax=Contarinia nasturtii TaxID=265458 RepID=UPI0012D43EFB|nr:uncharacterized protein LOC116347239 [Contarinia nasturtii]